VFGKDFKNPKPFSSESELTQSYFLMPGKIRIPLLPNLQVPFVKMIT